MPSHQTHSALELLLLKYANPQMDRKMDAAYPYLGRKHRVYGHDALSIVSFANEQAQKASINKWFKEALKELAEKGNFSSYEEFAQKEFQKNLVVGSLHYWADKNIKSDSPLAIALEIMSHKQKTRR